MVTYYADENVEGVIVSGLRLRGVDVLTIQEDGRIGLKPDALVLDRATELGRVLISMDRDLIEEATRRMEEDIDFVGVIYAAKNRSRWGRYIDDLDTIAKASEAHEYRSKLVRLPL